MGNVRLRPYQTTIACGHTSVKVLSVSFGCSVLKIGMLLPEGSGGEAGGVERMGLSFLNLETSLSISFDSSCIEMSGSKAVKSQSARQFQRATTLDSPY